MDTSLVKSIKLFVLFLLLCIGTFLLLKTVRPFGIGPWQAKQAIAQMIMEIFYYPVLYIFKEILFAPWIWLALALTLLMEHVLPAQPRSKFIGLNFAQDFVWFFYEAILHSLILTTYVALLISIYQHHFSGLTITAVNKLPDWAIFLFALLLQDLMYWLQHYLNHQVPVLWEFHKLHHSQQVMNFFTDFRYHVLEYLVRQTFLVIPFLVFAVKPPVIIAFVIVSKWYTRFYHGNIKTDLGLLRYLLVTPQSHRIHHSIENCHFDKNFGAIFSIWDFVFKTQYYGFKEYPATGILDSGFPTEKEGDLGSLLLTPIHQMIHPFKAIKRKWFCNKNQA